MKRFAVLLLICLLCGCCTVHPPLWSKANADQRARLYFRPDAAYYASDQHRDDFDRSVEAVRSLVAQRLE